MRFKHWFFIIIIQIILVAVGLFLYHLFLGGTKIDPGDAITIWATVITIVFIVFSVLGIMNIDGKMKEIDERKSDFKVIEEKSAKLLSTLETSRADIMNMAEAEIKKIIQNSSKVENYYQMFASIEADPAPDRRIAMYTDLIRNIPVIEGLDKAFPYIKRGAAYMQIGLFDKAKADFDFALANCTDINKSPVYASLGDYYVRKKDFKKAAECFEKALEANPSSAPLCSDLGNAYSSMGDFDKAMEYYDRALAINPESAGIYYNKAKRLHDTIPNPTEAENDEMLAYLNKSIALNPNFYQAYVNKASILRSQGKEAEAKEVLNQIVAPMLPPDFIMGIEQRGITYRLTGELPKAINDFNYVLFHEPHNIQNLCNLALVNLQMNNLGNADYFVRVGLQEAERKNNHSCDGDFFMVQETLINIQNQMRFPFGMVRDPGSQSQPTDQPETGPQDLNPESTK